VFTGIVRGVATVTATERAPGLLRLRVAFPPGGLERVQTGASIALAGTCLTVVEHDALHARFDVIDETLRRTTLGHLQPGDRLNYERAASFGDEVGGHLLSGHVLATATLVEIERSEHNVALTLRVPPDVLPYLFEKGYVGLDGCSLTLGVVDEAAHTFRVHLIPETLRLTTLGERRPGDLLNVEVDAITQAAVATVRRILERSRTTP
jgi:riboflavin synthase